MKKQYVSPMMVGERFEANEYVAACGDSGVVYKFTCDAGSGVVGGVYLETNGVDGLQTERKWVQTGEQRWDGYYVSRDTYLSRYEACGTTHEAESTSSFLNGYYVPEDTSEVVPVIVWRGPKNDNVHCTTNLNMNEWETAKS